MADITPIQMDAQGMVTFEKQEVQAIKVPMTDAEAKIAVPSKGKRGQTDQVKLSRPMKKHISKKKSYFKQASRNPAEQIQDSLKTQSKSNEVPKARLDIIK